MSDDGLALRVGIVRPDRPPRLIAEIESRVIRSELARRIGPVTCDLRIDGDPIADWASRATAAWPSDVDVVVDRTTLWSDDLPPLSSLFGRTIDAAGAEVRARMLEHLAVTGPVTDHVLTDEIPWRPSDVWIIARSHGVAADAHPSLRALTAETSPALDAAFDRVGADLLDAVDARSAPELIARLRARVAELEREIAERIDDARRCAVEAAHRLELADAQLAVLRERAVRTALDESVAP